MRKFANKSFLAVQINFNMNYFSFPNDGHAQEAGIFQEPVDILGRRDNCPVDVGNDVAGSHTGPVGRGILDHPEDQDSLVDVEGKLVTELELLDDPWVQCHHRDAQVPRNVGHCALTLLRKRSTCGDLNVLNINTQNCQNT